MIEITQMKEEHIKEVCRIENEAIAHPWSRQIFVSEMETGYSICRIAAEDGKVCAFICAQDISGETEINEIAVSKDFRRRGIASALINNVISYARKNGAYAANLEVRESNKGAIALYEKLGFAAVGKREKYYPDNGEAALLMTMRW